MKQVFLFCFIICVSGNLWGQIVEIEQVDEAGYKDIVTINLNNKTIQVSMMDGNVFAFYSIVGNGFGNENICVFNIKYINGSGDEKIQSFFNKRNEFVMFSSGKAGLSEEGNSNDYLPLINASTNSQAKFKTILKYVQKTPTFTDSPPKDNTEKELSSFFIIDGTTVNKKNRAILMIQLDKDSLMFLLGEGDKIEGKRGIKYKIEKVRSDEIKNEKGVAVYLNDYFGNGALNFMLIQQNRILLGSQDTTHNEIISIENLYDEDGNPFDFSNFYNSVNARNKSMSNSAPATPKPQASTAPSGKIEKIWLEHNVSNNGEKGMNVHCHFSVENMKGTLGSVRFSVYDSNGKQIKLNDNSKEVYNVGTKFTPNYDNAEYKDVVIFLSYSGFSLLPQGKSDLKLQVWIVSYGQNSAMLDTSNYESFTLTR